LKIFLIDDEASARNSMERVVREARPEAELFPFSRGQAALDAITDDALRPDVVFTDIQMPGLSGLSLAIRLRTVCPTAKIIFVTGYNEYAVDAYQLHAHGYVMKPLKTERVREELAHLERLTPLAAKPETLTVRCFGYFEVFWKGSPLHFQRNQTKELLAYLISRDGAACTNEEISTALWEDEADLRATNNRVRTLYSDLNLTLRQIGVNDALIRHRGSIAVNRERFDCDFFRMRNGDTDAVNSFQGEFMVQYSWAETVAGTLVFRE
jgi:two-component SAPR family response regulator